MKKALQPVIQIKRFIFFETDLNEPLPTLTARIPLEIRPATLEDVETFAKAFQEGGLDKQQARRRLEQGHSCILGLLGDQVVHFQWISFSSTWIPDIGATILLNPGEVYAYDAVTLPAWRGLGVHPAVSSFSDRYKRLRGSTRHFSFVSADNVQSLKSREKLWRKRTKTVWWVRVAGMKKPFIFGVTRAGSPSFTLHMNTP